MNKSVVIVGASGHGKVVADIVLKNKDNRDKHCNCIYMQKIYNSK